MKELSTTTKTLENKNEHYYTDCTTKEETKK